MYKLSKTTIGKFFLYLFIFIFKEAKAGYWLMLSLNSVNILHYQDYHFSLNIKKKNTPKTSRDPGWKTWESDIFRLP